VVAGLVFKSQSVGKIPKDNWDGGGDTIYAYDDDLIIA
jgi:hypothetical protein